MLATIAITLWTWTINGYSIAATRDGEHETTITIRDAGRRLVSQFRDFSAEIERVRDLDRDGYPDVIFELSGESMNRFQPRYLVFSLGPQPKCVLDIDSDSPGIEVIEQMDSSGPPKNALLFYVNFVSDWVGPRGGSPVPVVFEIDKGKAVEATRKYDWVVEKWRKQAQPGHSMYVSFGVYACVNQYQYRLFRGRSMGGLQAVARGYPKDSWTIFKDQSAIRTLFDGRSRRWRYPASTNQSRLSRSVWSINC